MMAFYGVVTDRSYNYSKLLKIKYGYQEKKFIKQDNHFRLLVGELNEVPSAIRL